MHQLSRLDKYYLLCCDRLAGAGVERLPAETPQQFLARAGQALPGMLPQLERITSLYTDLAYAGNGAEAGTEREDALQREFIAAVGKFRPRREK